MLFPPEIFALPNRTAAGEQINGELQAQATVTGTDAQPTARGLPATGDTG